jgi:hypothetical protein
VAGPQLHDRNVGWNLVAMTGAIATFMDAVGVPRAALAGTSRSRGWAPLGFRDNLAGFLREGRGR